MKGDAAEAVPSPGGGSAGDALSGYFRRSAFLVQANSSVSSVMKYIPLGIPAAFQEEE